MRGSLQERFESKCEPEPTSGCWLWTGAVDGDGYGVLYNSGDDRKTHRISWMIRFGPIPKGMSVLHKCDNPPCVNPDHLFLGTALDNMHDAMKKGRAKTWGALQAAKTHCKRGHLLSGSNVIVEKGKGRHCRTCQNALRRENRKAKHAVS